MKTTNHINYNEWVQDPNNADHITTTHIVGGNIPLGL